METLLPRYDGLQHCPWWLTWSLAPLNLEVEGDVAENEASDSVDFTDKQNPMLKLSRNILVITHFILILEDIYHVGVPSI